MAAWATATRSSWSTAGRTTAARLAPPPTRAAPASPPCASDRFGPSGRARYTPLAGGGQRSHEAATGAHVTWRGLGERDLERRAELPLHERDRGRSGGRDRAAGRLARRPRGHAAGRDHAARRERALVG